MMLPKVSVVVPVYNAEAFIKECLLCLRNQTYKNIEIICVDDGSLDKSAEIIERHANEDKRIVLIRQGNKGVAAARNTGLSILTGEYVMFCDADDFFQWETVEICVKTCLSHKGCEAVLFNARMFTAKGDNITAISGEQYSNIPQDIECDTSNYLGIFTCVWQGMFSVATIKENNIAFRSGYIYEDWDFVANFNAVAKKIRWVNSNLYNYRWNQNTSISGNVTSKCLDIFITWDVVKKHFEKNGRWANNQYSFYIKALEHILYFKRDRLNHAEKDVIVAFEEKAKEFIETIPYTMLCSLVHFFPMSDRISILSLHSDHDAEVEFCVDNLKRQKKFQIKAKIRTIVKKILMMISPTYRVAINTRFEMEQMHGELMGKLNEITWLQYETRKDVELIFHRLGIVNEGKITEDILVTSKKDDYIK